ncbi:MAG: hypothetical protein SNG38_06010 [Rikenellaceae bacterium]
MKKYILILSAAVLSMVSCAKEETEIVTVDQVTARIQIGIEDSVTSRADDGAARYVAQAFFDQACTTPAPVFNSGESNSIESATGVMEIIISATKEYYFLVWADDGQTYDVADLKSITLVEGAEALTEAWQGSMSIINEQTVDYSVNLTRAVARVDLVETKGFSGSYVTATYEGFSAFNIAIGSVSGSSETYSVTYEFEEEVIGQLNADEPLYIFAPVNYASVTDFYFESDTSEFTISNTPLQANYVTTISGNYSSSTPESTLVIEKDDLYENDDTIVTFNDSIFEAYVLDLLGKSSGEIVTVEEAQTITSMDINGMSITDLSGIECFTNLETLLCYGNSFPTLDLSAFTALSMLKTHNNTNLTEIIYPKDQSTIVTLYLHNTGISVLDLTEMTSLNYLSAYDNLNITTLDFRNCSKISKNVYCARCYDLETVYLTAAQSALAWNFKSITDCTFIVTETDGTETTYGSGEFSSFTWI